MATRARVEWLRPSSVVAFSWVGALVLLLAPGAATAQEQRCRDLGASCYCSEPLDNADTYDVAVHDPSDSTKRTRECGIYDAATPGQGRSDFPVRFPAGATVRNVLAVEHDTGLGKILVWPSPPSIDMTGRTFCVRSYRNYGRDHALPGNFKIARLGGPEGTVAWQSSWWPPGEAGTPSITWISALRKKGEIDVDCVLGKTGPEAQQIHFSDCQSHWCRFEICADHDASTGEFRVRGQWSQVGGPKRMETRVGAPGTYGPDCSPERSPTASIVGGIAVAEFASVCCPETTGGKVYMSHVMASHGPFDPDFWIGPAVEVEGRSGALPK